MSYAVSWFERRMNILDVHCSALCGRKAQGWLKVTEKSSIPMCDICLDLVDSDHKYEFVPFD